MKQSEKRMRHDLDAFLDPVERRSTKRDMARHGATALIALLLMGVVGTAFDWSPPNTGQTIVEGIEIGGGPPAVLPLGVTVSFIVNITENYYQTPKDTYIRFLFNRTGGGIACNRVTMTTAADVPLACVDLGATLQFDSQTITVGASDITSTWGLKVRINRPGQYGWTMTAQGV